MSNNIFWTHDISVLYKNNNYLNFFPTQKMTRIEQLNAVTRFSIYFLILALITDREQIWISVPIVIIIFIVVLYYIFETDNVGKLEEVYRENVYKTEEETYGCNNCSQSPKTPKNNKTDTISPIVIESGQYDSNGQLNLGSYLGSHTKKNTKDTGDIKYTYNQMKEYKGATCRMPTPDNPFMNTNANDFELQFPPEACNADDDKIKELITDSFNKNLFMDVSDLFERDNSQRQYYTVPHMNPPDTVSFAKSLYSSPNICKVDQSKCLDWQDIRYNR